MAHPIDWLFVFVIFFALLGFMVGILLYISNKDQSFSARILAAIFFCLSMANFGFGMSINQALLYYPFFYRVPVFFSLCIPALMFIYVRTILRQEMWFRKSDIIFLLIAVAYTIRFIPVYLASGAEKIGIISQALNNKSYYARELDAWLPGGWAIVGRIGYSLGLVIACFFLLFKWNRKLPDHHEVKLHNHAIYKWLVYLTTVTSLTYILLLVEYVFQISRFVDFYRVMAITVSGHILFITAYLLTRPYILYGLRGWVIPPVEAVQTEPVKPQREAVTYSLSMEQRLHFKTVIGDLFREQKPFIRPGYTIRDLSVETQIPLYQLSAFINQEYGKNFNEFINQLRVEYLQELVSSGSEYQQYTLEALGRLAGFKSRTAFIEAVKRKTGKTPSQLFLK